MCMFARLRNVVENAGGYAPLMMKSGSECRIQGILDLVRVVQGYVMEQ